ncbi:MAG: FHIPEP family type III secretion protein, partial [Thermoleophilia bacterium]|nr:FHIPEP family type III secretion protein [Thermoleophilia bacterium]
GAANPTSPRALDAAQGAAGEVIKSFGQLVTAGSLVIGLIMFIIITVVQFVVVAQGAGRVSEVAARFTLDAMPGKQMAIDAELNARIITPDEAKLKRADLEAESNFFGSMDGAMKFVKGHAIAGIIIVIVNLIGGLIIGGHMAHMPFGVAINTFSVLTIGQGLLEQIPALLISISAGMIVTRSASPKNLGSELGAQLVQSPRALGIASIIVALLGMVPHMPHLPLLALAAAVGATAFLIARKTKQSAVELEGELGEAATSQPEEISQQMLRTDPISLEVGAALAELADPDKSGELLERLKQVRRRMAMDFGVIAPGVRVRPHAGLEPGAYQIRIKGDLVAEGDVMVTHLLGIGSDLDMLGDGVEHTTDPIYGTAAVWLPRHMEQQALEHGMQVFDPQDVVSTHVSEVIKKNLAELLTREEVAELLNMARQDAPTVVAELVPNLLALGQIRQVLQNLVKEQVPIKDLPTILNSLADQAMFTKDAFQLTEHVRTALGRKICQRYQATDGLIRAFILSPDAERTIQNSIQFVENSQQLMLDPNQSKALQNNLSEALQRHRGQYLDPVIVVNGRIRRHVKALLERNFANMVVLSYSEVVGGVQLENLETVELH